MYVPILYTNASFVLKTSTGVRGIVAPGYTSIDTNSAIMQWSKARQLLVMTSTNAVPGEHQI